MDANRANTRIPERIVERELSYTLNGIFFRVHNTLGRFCIERQYSDAIAEELSRLRIPFERERVLEPSFAGERPGRHRVDFVVDHRILIEVKVKPALEREDFVQVHRYIEALHMKLGILVNFGTKSLVPRRILNSGV